MAVNYTEFDASRIVSIDNKKPLVAISGKLADNSKLTIG
jgi:hypothetical protein